MAVIHGNFPIPNDQPNDVSAEQILIGAMLMYGAPVISATLRRTPDLTDEDFSHPWHALAWRAAIGLYREGAVVDLITVPAALRRHGIPVDDDIRGYLVDCAKAVITVAAVPDHGAIIRDYADRRVLIALGQELIRDAQMQGERAASAAELRRRMVALLMDTSRDGAIESLATVCRRLRQRMDEPARITPTGFPRLDLACGGGFHADRLYGFQARSKVGKSTLMASIGFSLAMRQNPVPHAYFAAEMSPDEVAQALVSRWTGVPGDAFRDPGHRDRAKAKRLFDQTMKDYENKGLYYYGKARMHLEDLQEKMAQLCLGGKIKGAFVDYIQIIGGKQRNQSSAEFYDDVGQTLAELAKKYKIWICTAAQLNREGETRYGDGLLMACDRAFDLKVCDKNTPGEIWLEGLASRYTANADVGAPNCPRYRLVTGAGPYFEEI